MGPNRTPSSVSQIVPAAQIMTTRLSMYFMVGAKESPYESLKMVYITHMVRYFRMGAWRTEARPGIRRVSVTEITNRDESTTFCPTSA